MKRLIAGLLVAAAIGASASTANAYVVTVTTAIPMTAAQDVATFGAALRSAIQDVLDHAIAFTPAVVSVEHAKVVGDQLFLFLVIADKEGAAAIEALSEGDEVESAPPTDDGTTLTL